MTLLDRRQMSKAMLVNEKATGINKESRYEESLAPRPAREEGRQVFERLSSARRACAKPSVEKMKCAFDYSQFFSKDGKIITAANGLEV